MAELNSLELHEPQNPQQALNKQEQNQAVKHKHLCFFPKRPLT